MKVEDVSSVGFKPVSLKLTFETEDELKAFYCICNYGYLVDWAQRYGVDLDAVRNKLGQPDYSPLHQTLCSHMRKELRPGA